MRVNNSTSIEYPRQTSDSLSKDAPVRRYVRSGSSLTPKPGFVRTSRLRRGSQCTKPTSEYSHGSLRTFSVEEREAAYPPRPKRKKNKPRGDTNKQVQRDKWLSLIQEQEWELFVSLTFQHDVMSPVLARQRFDKWMGSLNCDLFGWRYRRKGKGIRYALGIEYQKRGVVHFHVLMSAPGLLENVSYKRMHALWQTNGQRNPRTGAFVTEIRKGKEVPRLVNGYLWVNRVEDQNCVTGYLTKYISKGGQIDLWLPRN